MIWGVLDPKVYLFSNSTNPSELEQSVLSLVQWQDLIGESLPKAYNTASGPECLARLNGFPLWADLGSRLRSSGSEVDIHDVIDVFNGLMKLPAMEDELGIRDFLFSNMDISPKDYEDVEPLLNEQFERACALLLLLKKSMALSDEQLLVLTRDLTFPPRSFTMKCTFDLFEMEDAPPPAQGEELSGGCKGINSFSQFPDCCNGETVWRHATTPSEVKLAIKTVLPPELRVLPWRLGARFFEAIKSQDLHNSAHAVSIIRACAEVVSRENPRDVHAIRVGPGANEAQKMRGRDSAWRRDINRDMHLHYWSTPTGPELAWITVAHNDMFIPE